MELQVAVRGESLEVPIEGEELARNADALGRDQAVHGCGGDSLPAARIGDLRGGSMVGPRGFQKRESLQETFEAAKFIRRSHAGEELLEDDSRDRQRRILLDEAGELRHDGRLGNAPPPTPESQREDARVEDDQRRRRAFLTS